jgi:hypothetical protein
MKPTLSLALLFAATAALAAPPEHYLHVRVDGMNTNELVRVSIPLSLAEKVIPAIHHGQLRDGKVQMGNFQTDCADLRAILDAVKSAPDGEFVTVQEPDSNVRVAKKRGQLIVHVIDKNDGQKVEVTIPWEVAQALASATNQRQLNIKAAIEALDRAGDTTRIIVSDHDETVRVWIDSRDTAD